MKIHFLLPVFVIFIFTTLIFTSSSAFGFETKGAVHEKYEILPEFLGDPVHQKITRDGLDFLNTKVLDVIVSQHLKMETIQTSENHFDDCDFYGASTNIRNLQNNALDEIGNGNYDGAAQQFGLSLHPIQDFYSHTNWVELGHTTLVNNNTDSWATMGAYSTIKDGPIPTVIIQGEDIPLGIELKAQEDERKVIRVQDSVDKSLLAYGLISGTYGLSDDCPNEDATISHGGVVKLLRIFHEILDDSKELNKDQQARLGFKTATDLAQRQTTHEWCRLVSLVEEKYDQEKVEVLFDKWVEDVDKAKLVCNIECDFETWNFVTNPPFSFNPFPQEYEYVKAQQIAYCVDQIKKDEVTPWYACVPDCPYTAQEARNNADMWVEESWLSEKLFCNKNHPGSEDCFRSKFAYHSMPGTHHGQQCIYDEKGSLITEGPGGGSADVWSPEHYFFNHMLIDVNTFKTLGWEEYHKHWPTKQGGTCDEFKNEIVFDYNFGGKGKSNGKFIRPNAIAHNDFGILYITDETSRIQKFNQNGKYLGQFSDNENDSKTTHSDGITVNNDNNIIVADQPYNHLRMFHNEKIIKEIGSGCLLFFGNFNCKDPDGKDGPLPLGASQFDRPTKVFADRKNEIFVADTGNHRIQKFDKNFNFLSQLGQFGILDGQFIIPSGMDEDSWGNLYVVDTGNHRIQKFDAKGNFIDKWGWYGSGPGQFILPNDLAIDKEDSVYVSDYGNHRIQKFTSEGEYLLEFGGGRNNTGGIFTPNHIVVNDDNEIYVSDYENHLIKKFHVEKIPISDLE